MGWNSGSHLNVVRQIADADVAFGQLSKLDDKRAILENEVSGFASQISELGASLGQELAPLILNAQQYLLAAKEPIEQARTVAFQNQRAIRSVRDQLGMGRAYRTNNLNGFALVCQANTLYSEISGALNTVSGLAVYKGCTPRSALSVAERLVQQIKRSIDD